MSNLLETARQEIRQEIHQQLSDPGIAMLSLNRLEKALEAIPLARHLLVYEILQYLLTISSHPKTQYILVDMASFSDSREYIIDHVIAGYFKVNKTYFPSRLEQQVLLADLNWAITPLQLALRRARKKYAAQSGVGRPKTEASKSQQIYKLLLADLIANGTPAAPAPTLAKQLAARFNCSEILIYKQLALAKKDFAAYKQAIETTHNRPNPPCSCFVTDL